MTAKERVYGEQERFKLLISGLPVWAILVRRAGRMVVQEFMPKRVVREFIAKLYESFVKERLDQLPEHLRAYRIVMQYHRCQGESVLCFFWSEKHKQWHWYWGDPKTSLIGEFVILSPSLPWS